MLSQGDTLGIYRIEEPLAPGGMGQVYRAIDPRLNRGVAVKILTKQAESRAARRRFFREARALAALSHPNIIVVHDVGDQDGTHYIVSELLEGSTLQEVIERGPISWCEAVEIAIEIIAGLGAAHSIGLVHRDLKPSNVFYTEDRRIKILDFGLVVYSSGHARLGPEETDTKTAPMAGTGGYMAPEQIESTGVDHRSDIFGFGCVLYEMLTGERAFKGPTLIGTLKSVVCDEPAPFVDYVADIPQELETIVHRCLAKDPDERFQSAREIESALRAVRGGTAKRPQGWQLLRRTAIRWLRRFRRYDGRVRSLAVLPFANASGQLDNDPLGNGLPESMIRHLSRLEEMRVIAWGTAARYQGSILSPDQIGQDLDVEAVLTGRILRHERGIQVTVEMIASRSGDHLWGERFAGGSSDPVLLLDELAQKIGLAVEEHLRGKPKSSHHTLTSEVPLLYARGRYFWNRRDAEDLERSRQCFERALDRDPGFAAARSGLADIWSVQPFWGLTPPTDAFPRAREEAVRALALEPTLGEAHASLAYVRFYFDWDWQGAEASFEDALRHSPNYSTAYHWAGMCAALRGDFKTAFERLEQAHQLDPLSLIINADTGLVHYLAGEPEMTLKLCEAARELDDRFVPAMIYVGLAMTACQRHEEAVELLEKTVNMTHRSAPALAALGHAFGLAGQLDWAVEILAELRTQSTERYVSSYHLAVVQSALGQIDDALRSLQQAADERSEMMPWLLTDPRLALVRNNPRCTRILELLRFTDD